MHYLIEFRFSGYAKRYLKELIYEVAEKFHVKGVTKKRVVPHITLIAPFTLGHPFWPLNIFIKHDESRMVDEVVDIVKKYSMVTFKLKGFDKFDNSKVIYANVKPSDKLKELQKELVKRLKRFCKLAEYDLAGDFKPHATIAFKDTGKKFNSIYGYIKRKEQPEINQQLLRVTIIKGQKILYEYDLIQKKLLSRTEAKNKKIFARTIQILKQKQMHN